MATAFLLVLGLAVLNGLFSMAELAIVSARKSRLEARAAGGSKGAATAIELAREPNRFLSTVQIGITLIGIMSGAFGEAAIGEDLAALYAQVPALEAYASLLSTASVVVVITYLSLVIGELVPKRVALAAPDAIARVMAPPMHTLSRVAAPIVWFLSTSTEVLLRPFRGLLAEKNEVTEEDIKGMLSQAAETGAVLEQEQKLVERVFELNDLRVRNLMVPRHEIDWLEAEATPEQVSVAVGASPHSHFPLCEGGLDKLLGIVHIKDIIKHTLVADALDLRELAQKPLYIPENAPAIRVLETFRQRNTHIGLAVDEHGSLAGLVTLNDLVSAIIGRVATEPGIEEPLEFERPDGSRLLAGNLPVARLQEILDVDELPGHDRADFDTLGGFVLAFLGHIPHAGERFECEGYTFEVLDMDGKRVDKVLLAKMPEAAPPGEGV